MVKQYKIKAGWICTCVGSLSKCHLRFANQPSGEMSEGPFEILSLTGTLSQDGCHLHLSISDGTGVTKGGHLIEGCLVFTTAEVIIAASDEFYFERQIDKNTGWKELIIKQPEN